MRYFTVRSDGAYVSFDGMAQETIVSMLEAQSLTCEFITEEAYNVYVVAHQG